MSRKKVLLGHLNSMGDCLFATVIARQIKEVDHPGCHLTWAVNSRCKQAVVLNPFVDDIWEVETEKPVTSPAEWKTFVAEVEKKKAQGEFDLVYLTQILGNLMNYDGGIRSSTYNNYPYKITVPHHPIIRLSDEEIDNVKAFAGEHRLQAYESVILIESAPDSFESSLNPRTGYELALELSRRDDTAAILSSAQPLAETDRNIVDASKLSFRENAELTKYCDLFIGCGSGLSWLATSDWAKQLNMILVISQDNAVFPSLIYDHEFIDLRTDHIIEIRSDQEAIGKVLACVDAVRKHGFANARKTYNEGIALTNYNFLIGQIETCVLELKWVQALKCLYRTVKRNGAGFLLSAHFGKVLWHFPKKLMSKTRRVLFRS